jgi:hypothetical protein
MAQVHSSFSYMSANLTLRARIWSGSSLETESAKSPVFYITVYAIVSEYVLFVHDWRLRLLSRSLLLVSRAEDSSICL